MLGNSLQTQTENGMNHESISLPDSITGGDLSTNVSGKSLIITIFTLCLLCLYANPAMAGGTWNAETCHIVDDGTSDGPGPFMVESMTIGETTIHYPVGMAESGCKFPVIGWGNGSGTRGGDAYPEYFNQLASHGFVVAASHSPAVTGELILASVQIALNENANPASPLYQKLESKFGVMGKSLGAIAAANAVQMSPDAIAAVMIAGSQPGVSDPGLFVSGTGDFLRQMVENSYNAATGPAIYAEEVGATHLDLSSSEDVAELATSFMRCYLRGDASAYNYIISPASQIGGWERYELKNDRAADLYSAWAAQYPELGTENASPTAHGDAGRHNNLFEYACGGDPTDPTDDILLEPVLDHRVESGDVIMEYRHRRRKDYASVGLVYTVSHGFDLVNWSAEGVFEVDVSSLDASPGYELVTVRITIPADAPESSRHFVYLKVSQW